jgi:hypothetical protein
VVRLAAVTHVAVERWIRILEHESSVRSIFTACFPSHPAAFQQYRRFLLRQGRMTNSGLLPPLIP